MPRVVAVGCTGSWCRLLTRSYTGRLACVILCSGSFIRISKTTVALPITHLLEELLAALDLYVLRCPFQPM